MLTGRRIGVLSSTLLSRMETEAIELYYKSMQNKSDRTPIRNRIVVVTFVSSYRRVVDATVVSLIDCCYCYGNCLSPPLSPLSLVSPHDVAPHDVAPHDVALHDVAPHDVAPREARDVAPHDVAPHDVAPHDVVRHEAYDISPHDVRMWKDASCLFLSM
jgi:hypothetical protein